MGSACVFFDSSPKQAILSDFNSDLIQFFEVLKERPSALSVALRQWSPGGEDYYAVRELVPPILPSETRAARFLYLNRFAFNGVYRTNRQGQFNVPRGIRTGQLPTLTHLQQASMHLRTATVARQDYRETTAKARRGDFVYLDPPYRNDTRSTYGEYGYGAFGSSSDVATLALELDRLSRVGAYVMLSFNDDSGLEHVLDEWVTTRVSRRRNVAAAAENRTVLKGEILSTNYSRVRDIA